MIVIVKLNKYKIKIIKVKKKDKNKLMKKKYDVLKFNKIFIKLNKYINKIIVLYFNNYFSLDYFK